MSKEKYCTNCGEEMRFLTRDRTYRLGDSPSFVISNIPAYECWNCGELEYTDEIVELFSNIIKSSP